jgi:hypothetical protein
MPINSNSDPLTNKAVIGLALQLGFAVSITAVLFVYGGHWLDTYFDTAPSFFWAGAGLGLLASLLLVYRIMKPLRDKVNLK